jgi:hypothetical protein
MSKRILTTAEQLQGIRTAISSPRTPVHLRAFLEKRRKQLIAKIDGHRTARKKWRPKPKRPPGILDWLGL